MFFRYSENNEEMIELASRYDEFMGLLKQYNQENELVIIYHDDIDEAIAEKVPNSYRVYKDEGDVVTHHPLIQNNILFDLLNTADFSLREKNLIFEKEKREAKQNLPKELGTRLKRKLIKMGVIKPYIHYKLY